MNRRRCMIGGDGVLPSMRLDSVWSFFCSPLPPIETRRLGLYKPDRETPRRQMLVRHRSEADPFRCFGRHTPSSIMFRQWTESLSIFATRPLNLHARCLSVVLGHTWLEDVDSPKILSIVSKTSCIPVLHHTPLYTPRGWLVGRWRADRKFRHIFI